jgi:hypothetical protein
MVYPIELTTKDVSLDTAGVDNRRDDGLVTQLRSGDISSQLEQHHEQEFFSERQHLCRVALVLYIQWSVLESDD